MGVGQLDPLDGIHIHRQVPFMDLLGIDPEQHGIQSGHHKALDVMGIAVVQGLPDDL